MAKKKTCQDCEGTGKISLFNWTEGGAEVDCPYCEIDRLTAELEEAKAGNSVLHKETAKHLENLGVVEREAEELKQRTNDFADALDRAREAESKLAAAEKDTERKQGRIDEMYEERSLLILEKGALRAQLAEAEKGMARLDTSLRWLLDTQEVAMPTDEWQSWINKVAEMCCRGHDLVDAMLDAQDEIDAERAVIDREGEG